MANGPLRAVITGGSKGIGLALAAEIARRPGAKVVFGGRSPYESLPPATRTLLNSLPSGSAYYHSIDVTDSDSTEIFRANSVGILGEGGNPCHYVVIANAGLSALDKDAERVEAMKRTNIGGTENTYNAFRQLLMLHGGTFMTLSSIVATRGIVIPGNQGYFDTKVVARVFALGAHAVLARNEPPGRAWALAPGAVRTDMTEEGVLFGSLGLAVAKRASTDPDLRAGLGVYFRAPAESFDNVTTVLGAMFGDATEGRALGMARRVLQKDPAVSGGRTQLAVASALAEGAVLGRVAGLLVALDIAMTPEVFARRVVDFIERGEHPTNGVLEMFSARDVPPDQAPILSYLSAIAPAAAEGSG